MDVDMPTAFRKLSRRKQKGAAAIEFAVVFVVFFAVFYGVVSYSLPLLMVQSFNAAASEAVRRSVALSPTIANYDTLLVTQARTVLTNQLAWMPAGLNFTASDMTVSYTAGVLTVSIHYPKSKLTRILPVLTLPGIGEVPNLPTNLSARASLQLVP
ncbi:pilus assembly protein TadE [Pseudomonas cichorii]|nr:pilus assembly protein TadE [Pseudomonas cichorii]